jgi:hypothetical protein
MSLCRLVECCYRPVLNVIGTGLQKFTVLYNNQEEIEPVSGIIRADSR